MTCRELAELLLDFVDGELPGQLRLQIEEHVRVCPPCEHYVATYRVTIRLTRKLSACEELPDGLRCRCEELLRQERGYGGTQAHP